VSPTPEQPDWALLTRYVTNNLSPAERAAVERWFAADPAKAELEQLRDVWRATGGVTTGWDTDKAIANLRDQISGGRSITGPAAIIEPPRRSRTWWLAGAALAASVAGFYLLRPEPPSPPTPVVAEVAPTDVTTRRGQQAEIRLPDGTRVILSAASSLRYFSDYGQRERRLILDGEGYFMVTHDPSRPFRVESENGIAEDLGTSFVVRARGKGALTVVVTEGAVVLRPKGDSTARPDSLVLTRGQLGRVLPDGALGFRTRADTTAWLAWTRGELVFTDTPLAEVAAELSRWYDADIRVSGAELAWRPFSGRLKRRSAEEAVRLIAAVTGAEIHRTDGGWTFR
jgi:ferric-dicitrate binding protein FerR (iron transport regulator)